MSETKCNGNDCNMQKKLNNRIVATEKTTNIITSLEKTETQLLKTYDTEYRQRKARENRSQKKRKDALQDITSTEDCISEK